MWHRGRLNTYSNRVVFLRIFGLYHSLSPSPASEDDTKGKQCIFVKSRWGVVKLPCSWSGLVGQFDFVCRLFGCLLHRTLCNVQCLYDPVWTGLLLAPGAKLVPLTVPPSSSSYSYSYSSSSLFSFSCTCSTPFQLS